MIDLNKEINFLRKKVNSKLESIVLFGSYSRNEEKKNSEIKFYHLIIN